MSDGFEQHELKRTDGTRIAYYTAGPCDAPALLVSCGLGGGRASWRGIVDRFKPSKHIIVWDYRGLYASGPAADGSGYAMEEHARDLGAIIDQLQLDRPLLLGWSMGVQVNFELLRQRPDVASGLVAIHGAYRHPVETAFNSKMPKGVPRLVFGGMRRYWQRFAPIFTRAGKSRVLALQFMRGCQRLGLISSAADGQMFYEMAREWVKLDLGIYADIFEHLGRHNAEDVLATITIPTLVVAGQRDVLTPPELSLAIVERVAGAELFMLPDGTHFGPLEYPDEIADRIEVFITDRVIARP
jgi:pimeloyl-ACP methyl ester carboxylesterase